MLSKITKLGYGEEQFSSRKSIDHNLQNDTLPDNVPNVPLSREEAPMNISKRGHIPSFSRSAGQKYEFTLEANKYLEKQYDRLMKFRDNDDKERFLKLWTILYQRSGTVCVYFYIRTYRDGYYHRDMFEQVKIIRRSIKQRRTLNTNLGFERVYIPKPTGVKGEEATGVRPLGVPFPEARITLAFVSFMLQALVEKSIGDYQFGFRPGKNVWDCGKVILHKIKVEGKKVYEFDLKACFNKLPPRLVGDILSEMNFPPEYILYIHTLITNVPRLDGEKGGPEIFLGGSQTGVQPTELDEEIKGDPKIANMRKNGLPQGGSLSPILAILMIDKAMKTVKWDKVMYADDGLFFSDEPLDIEKKSIDDGTSWNRYNLELAYVWESLGNFGMFQSLGLKKDKTPKCGHIEDKLTFLGITYSIKTDRFYSSSLDLWLPNNEHTLEFLKKEYQGVNPYIKTKPKEGTGNIHRYSGLSQRILMFLVSDWNIFTGNLHNFVKGLFKDPTIKRFGGMFLPFSEISSMAANDLLAQDGLTKKGDRKLISGDQKFSVVKFNEDYRKNFAMDPDEYELFPGYDPQTGMRFKYRSSYLLRKDLLVRSNTVLEDFPNGLRFEDPNETRAGFMGDLKITA